MWCPKFSSTLAIKVCLERQDMVKQRANDGGQNHYFWCLDCEQGKKARAGELNDKDVEAIRASLPTPKKEEVKVEGQKEYTVGKIETKTCIRCGKVWPLDQFSPAKKSKDGHRSDCKACVATYARERLNKLKGGIVKKSPKKSNPLRGKGHPAAPDSPNHTITLRFNAYPDLQKEIIAKAQEELRTPENLIPYCVDRYFKERTERGTV